jgi:sulfur relay (sulfurtransferase) complex TusBCD TusD component (DsrE family)
MTHKLKGIFAAILIVGFFLSAPLRAEEDKSQGLFINLTTLQTGPAGHAMHFAGTMMERGHPVTVFLNQNAVLFASKSAPQATFAMAGKTIRDMMVELMEKGMKVIVCKMCTKMHGVDPADFIAGAELGNPELVASYLFDPKYKAISW